MSWITLDKGKVALLDECDLEKARGLRWFAQKMGRNWYACASLQSGGKKRTVLLHRLLLDAPTGVEVDHIDGNGLNNRRFNLRLATHSQNLKNQQRRITNRSGFKGVHFHRLTGKWRAQITVDGRIKSLGLFAIKEEAARAYDAAATTHHGDFARLNFGSDREVCHL